MFDTIIRNVRVIKDDAWHLVDLGIIDESFAEISPNITGNSKSEVDGDSAYCLPGMVDLHVHFNEPGRTHWEGFTTGSAAASAAGLSYLAEMPLNSIPSTTSVDALYTKLAAINNKSYVDFGLWGGIVPGNINDIEPLAKAGVVGFKAFMAPSGNDDFLNSDRSTLRKAMYRIAQTGLRLALHAEDPTVVDRATERLKRTVSAFDWDASRPIEAEISATKTAIELSLETGCPITIVHVSSAEVLSVIQNAKRQGVDIICETCPHYLLFSRVDADIIGADAKCAPPLRSKARMRALEVAVFENLIDTIGSDHSPSPPEMKEGQSFFDAWGGIAGIQHGYPLLISRYGMDVIPRIKTIQRLCCENPAKVINLKSKGSIDLNKDADFTLIKELESTSVIEGSSLLTKHQRSAYIGAKIKIELAASWLRGNLVSSNGKLLENSPRGKFIPYSY